MDEDGDEETSETFGDSLYFFLRYRRGSRGKVGIKNEEMFIIFGQNAVISVLIILLWILVRVFKFGKMKATFPTILSKVYYILISAFFIQFQFICTAELAFHDMTRLQPWYMQVSFGISWVIYGILVLELVRAWDFAKRGGIQIHLVDNLNSDDKHLYQAWMAELSTDYAFRGHVFQVRERIRWCIFQILVVCLQILNFSQIFFITLVEVVYVTWIFKELRNERIFKTVWLKGKVMCQEIAIMFFLVVLCIFALTEGTGFEDTWLFDWLEVGVFIAVIIAILAEAVNMLMNILLKVCDLLKKRKNSKEEKQEEYPLRRTADKHAVRNALKAGPPSKEVPDLEEETKSNSQESESEFDVSMYSKSLKDYEKMVLVDSSDRLMSNKKGRTRIVSAAEKMNKFTPKSKTDTKRLNKTK